jgi:hypothetical protein
MNGTNRDVRVYALFGDAWKKVLSNEYVTGTSPSASNQAATGRSGPNSMRWSWISYIGNRECPTRRAASASAQVLKIRSCVVRWNGTKFT